MGFGETVEATLARRARLKGIAGKMDPSEFVETMRALNNAAGAALDSDEPVIFRDVVRGRSPFRPQTTAERLISERNTDARRRLHQADSAARQSAVNRDPVPLPGGRDTDPGPPGYRSRNLSARQARGERVGPGSASLTPALETVERGANIGGGVVRDPFGTVTEIGAEGGGFGAAAERAERIGGSPTGVEAHVPLPFTDDIRFDIGREAARLAGDPLNAIPGLGIGPRQFLRLGGMAVGDVAQTGRAVGQVAGDFGEELGQGLARTIQQQIPGPGPAVAHARRPDAAGFVPGQPRPAAPIDEAVQPGSPSAASTEAPMQEPSGPFEPDVAAQPRPDNPKPPPPTGPEAAMLDRAPPARPLPAMDAPPQSLWERAMARRMEAQANIAAEPDEAVRESLARTARVTDPDRPLAPHTMSEQEVADASARAIDLAELPPRRPPPPDLPADDVALLDEVERWTAGLTENPLPILEDFVPPGESPGKTALANLKGADKARQLELERLRRALLESFVAKGVLRKVRGRYDIVDEAGIDQFNRSMHGLAAAPANMRGEGLAMRRLIEAETHAMRSFDGELLPGAGLLPEDEQYFPRFLKPPATRAGREGGKGRFGAKRGFQHKRRDDVQDYGDLIDNFGWLDGQLYRGRNVNGKLIYEPDAGPAVELERARPLSDNPVEMLMYRLQGGAEYRQQVSTLEALKAAGLTMEADGPLPHGWEVPEIGPAFEGRPRVRDGKQFGTSNRTAVPSELAQRLETMFGRRQVGVRVHGYEIGRGFTNAQYGLKQTVLAASFFQQIDFAQRATSSVFAGGIDDLLHGRVLSAAPKLTVKPAWAVAQLGWANVSPARRIALKEKALSRESMVQGRDIHHYGIVRAGRETSDPSLTTEAFRNQVSQASERLVAEVIDEGKNLGVGAPFLDAAGTPLKIVADRVRAIHGAVARGLFDGVYEAAQQVALENFIVPRLVRAHPNWTDQQIMAQAARDANVMFSTMPGWQTLVANRQTKAVMHNLMFSSNETESHFRAVFGLLRPAQGVGAGLKTLAKTRSVKEAWRSGWDEAEKGSLWYYYWGGMFLMLAATANAVHYATTGSALPLDRYTPMKKNDYGPFPMAYNSKFLAPSIPLRGRDGKRVTLDLLNQADTVFRVLDPSAFLRARLNVVPSAGLTQYEGSDYFGRPIQGAGERVQQAAYDVGAPIAARHALGVAGVGPAAEQRLGPAAQAAQMLGVNLRSTASRELRDQAALAHAAALRPDNPASITGFDDLERHERLQLETLDPELQAELALRREESAGQVGEFGDRARASIAVDEARERYRVEQEHDDGLYRIGQQGDEENGLTGGQWRARHSDRRKRMGAELPALRAHLEEIERDPAELTAMDHYIEAIEAAKDEGGVVDWDQVDLWLLDQEPETIAYIDRNTGLGLTAVEQERRHALQELKATGFFEIDDAVWARLRVAEGAPPFLADYDTFDDYAVSWRTAMQRRLIAEGVSPPDAKAAARKLFGNDPFAQAQEAAASQVRERWALANPLVAGAAIAWDYYTPTKPVLAERLGASASP